MKEIILKFDPTVSRLSGTTFGELIFIKQVKSKLEPNKNHVILFPSTIKNLSNSFAEGFLKDMPYNCIINGSDKVVAKTKEILTDVNIKKFEPE